MAGLVAGIAELSGAEVAVVAPLAMGENVAANVLQHYGRACDRHDLRSRWRTIGIDATTHALSRPVDDLEQMGVITPDGFEYLWRELVTAFGDATAHDIIERIMRSSDGNIDVLSDGDPKMLVEQLGGERLQLLTGLLGHMNRLSAVAFLTTLSDDAAAEIVYRYACMGTRQLTAMAELRVMLSETLSGHIEARLTTIGGVQNAANLANDIGNSAAECALAPTRDVDPETAPRLWGNMFTFDDLKRLNDQALPGTLPSVPSERLVPALCNVSKKTADHLRDEIENGPMVTRSDAQVAQRAVIEAAMALAQEGKVSLDGEEGLL